MLHKLYKIPVTFASSSGENCRLINKAFNHTSAHVRARCLDVLALWYHPQLSLYGGSAGEMVLWHTNDGDARVRVRAYHCLISWLSVLVQNNTVKATNHNDVLLHPLESSRKEILHWMELNLGSVYAVACRGLLDDEELVRRASLLLIDQLSILWPHHELINDSFFDSTNSTFIVLDENADTTTIRLVDDAFSRVCVRLQDPSRFVRQLAVQTMSDLAKCVSEECLLQTLEKTIMTDRQVHRSLQDSTFTVKQPDGTVARQPLNLLATDSNGAIITGLEDDYFEVRCTTLATVNQIALLNARFAQNCQDLLVDMLTDDIESVRLSAVRALGAVGNEVPVKSRQIAIITSALAEGSGCIRRRLHYLLSKCRLASAPCLISLLDGLLQNLRRYPQDRDNIWRCAASVGRNHPVFVHTCLSSLLRTHSWLSGPEPNKEDPAYLTVLLLVLNAEPIVPGMRAKFPRHLVSTKVYLKELLPSLLPRSTTGSSLDLLFPDRLLTVASNQNDETTIQSARNCDQSRRFSLYKFVNHTVCRIQNLLIEITRELQLDRDVKATGTDKSTFSTNRNYHKSHHQRQVLLGRLVFTDLCISAQQLDRAGDLQGLIYWLSLIVTISWCLITSTSVYFFNSHDPTIEESITRTDIAICERITKLLNRAFRNSLCLEYLFLGKTSKEIILINKLRCQLFDMIQSFIQTNSFDLNIFVNTQNVIIQLLGNNFPQATEWKSTSSPMPRKRPYPFADEIHSSFDEDNGDANWHYLLDLSRRLRPIYAMLIQPKISNMSNNLLSMVLTNLTTKTVLSNEPTKSTGVGVSAIKFTDETEEAGHVSIWSQVSTPTNQFVEQVRQVPEVRFTAILASCAIRIRALIIGLNLEMARQHVCVIFRRPDVLKSSSVNLHSASSYHYWWPPSNAWNLIDEECGTGSVEHTKHTDCLEIRTQLELTAGRWSDAGTVELGLGYCLRYTEYATSSPMLMTLSTNDHMNDSSTIVLPMTASNAKIKLVPCAPITQW